MDNRFGDIETFLAVANGGSLASAARALRLTPSAVSRSIARLEQRLGLTLIRRTTRSLALTGTPTVRPVNTLHTLDKLPLRIVPA